MKKKFLDELLAAICSTGLVILFTAWLAKKLAPPQVQVGCRCQIWKRRVANLFAFLVLVASTVATVKLIWRIC